MKRTLALLLLAFLLGGCSGVIIKPLTAAEAKAHREGGGSGYLVYEPTIYFAVSQDDKKACIIGKPFGLPDYSRPYRVDSKSGLGKSGVDISITDGWILGGFKDNSDNTSLLTSLMSVAGFKDDPEKKGADSCQVGLYVIVKDGSGRIEKAVGL